MDRDLVKQLLDQAGAERNRDVLAEIIRTAYELAGDDADRLNLKITRDALKEMRAAFRMFAPYEEIRKVTVFGSARTHPSDPLYEQAKVLARKLAEAGWMVVTGAGPGIMEAANVGAGRDRSIGINIRLPFEEGISDLFAGSDKLVSMKYFFTRKLMLIKESSGFVSLPGGFGTLDETYELLTLFQTGKATPSPLVLLDVKGLGYWEGWQRFVDEQLKAGGLVSPGDSNLYLITDDVDEAVAEVRGFWRNYHSMRWVGGRLVVRLQAEPTAKEIAELTEEFSDVCTEGGIEASPPLQAEVSDRDELDRPRLVMQFDVRKGGRFRSLIEALNRLPSAPPLT
ncbi:MAG TPA: TIGR00730 family Rossman fold protein [Acidimicrobiales bacterium]|nr:TIGR00730 family Rossman fold protein [Acidimicrobiales bacterium]